MAYFVPQTGQSVSDNGKTGGEMFFWLLNHLSALRAHLREKLPVYAIPSDFVCLTRMPLNPNGKIDKARLPFPDTVTSHNKKSLDAVSPIQQMVIECWKDVLHRSDFRWESVLATSFFHLLSFPSLSDDFFSIGGNSVSATMLVFALRKRFQTDLPLSILYQNPTISLMADAISRLTRFCDQKTKMSLFSTKRNSDVLPNPKFSAAGVSESVVAVDLEKESVLPADIVLKSSVVTGPRVFFLTGATGFLGAYILRDLLMQFVDSRVICLVRGSDGMARVVQNLQANHVFSESFTARISVVEGNLEQERFGLSQEKFDQLCEDVEAVVHNGAVVNWVLPFSRLRNANVGSTLDVLRLCAKG